MNNVLKCVVRGFLQSSRQTPACYSLTRSIHVVGQGNGTQLGNFNNVQRALLPALGVRLRVFVLWFYIVLGVRLIPFQQDKLRFCDTSSSHGIP